MTSDHRITPGLIHDILDALERHGYYRSDDLHADRAIGLIGDLACIYEGTQDHPAIAYPIAVPPPATNFAASALAAALVCASALAMGGAEGYLSTALSVPATTAKCAPSRKTSIAWVSCSSLVEPISPVATEGASSGAGVAVAPGGASAGGLAG